MCDTENINTRDVDSVNRRYAMGNIIVDLCSKCENNAKGTLVDLDHGLVKSGCIRYGKYQQEGHW